MIQELWAIKSDLIWAGKSVYCAWQLINKCLIDFLYMYCWYLCCSICTEQTKENKGICKCQRHQPRSVFLIFFIRAVWIWCWYVLDLLNMMICFSWYTELLLGIPELLPRLVNLAVSRDCKYLYWYKTSNMYCISFFDCFKRIHLKCSISVQKDKRPEAKC